MESGGGTRSVLGLWLSESRSLGNAVPLSLARESLFSHETDSIRSLACRPAKAVNNTRVFDEGANARHVIHRKLHLYCKHLSMLSVFRLKTLTLYKEKPAAGV